ncbi:hypothetical protein H4R35_000557 [Dimargaris xerosporica]|nr:hypothetical protein H4R35_000557 [Dimargaris xerosporica]
MASVENGDSCDQTRIPRGAEHRPGSASPARPPLVKPPSTPEVKGLTLDHVDQFLREEVGTPIVEADDVQSDMLQRYGPQRSQPFRVEPYPLPSLPTQPVRLTSASAASPPQAAAQSVLAAGSPPQAAKAQWQSPAALTIPKQAKYRTSSLGNGEPMYQSLSPDNPAASPNPNHQEVQSSPNPYRSTGASTENTGNGDPGFTAKQTPPPTASPPVAWIGSQGGRAKATRGSPALPTFDARTPTALVKSLSPSRTPESTSSNGIDARPGPETLNPPRRAFRPSSVGASDAPAGLAASEAEMYPPSLPNHPVRHRRASTGDKDGTVGGSDGPGVPAAATGGGPSPPTYDNSPGLSAVFLKRNADFHMLFKEIPISELLIDDYGCALQRDILVQGRLYITESYICFHANIFGWITHLVIQFAEIVSIEKRMTALIIPNAIQLSTLHTRYFFASFIYRDAAYSQLLDLWKKHHPCKISTTDTSARRLPSARTSEDISSITKTANHSGPGALGQASTEIQHGSADFTDSDHSYLSDDSDWSGSSYTDGYSDSHRDASDDEPADSWDAADAAELEPPGDQPPLHAIPDQPGSPALGAANSVTATTSKLARTIQRLVQRSDEPSADDNGAAQLRSASGSSTATSGTPTHSRDPATTPVPHNQSEANLSRVSPAQDGPRGLVRSRSAHRPESTQLPGPTADGSAASPNSTRFSGKRVGHGASSVSNVYATHVVTRSNRSAMLTTGAQSGRHSPAPGQTAVPRHSRSAPHTADPGDGIDNEAEGFAPDDQTAMGTPKSSTSAPVTHPPTTTTCACLSAHEHYDYQVVDEVFPCALPVMYRLLFDGSVPPGITPPEIDDPAHQSQYHDFMLNFLVSEKQNNKNVQYSGWQPGTTLPENTPSTVYDRAIETRTLQYIRPINAPIGPKSTKCELTEICLAKDFDRAVVVDSTTYTTDVPSGSCFHTKARVCLMHAGDFKTRMIASHKIVWTKSSWIKGAIEKGSIDGNNCYFAGLRDFLHQFLTQHQEFTSLPDRPARGLEPPTAATSKSHDKSASRPKDPRERQKRGHRRHHRGRRSRKHMQGDDPDVLCKEQGALLQQAAQVGQRTTPDPNVLERTTNPLFRWVYSWFPLVTPSQLETTIKDAPLPAKVLSSAEVMSSTLAPTLPTIRRTATVESQGAQGVSPSAHHSMAPQAMSRSHTVGAGSDQVQSYGTEFSYWLMSFLLCLGLALLVTISGLMWLEMRALSAHLTTMVDQQSQLLALQQPLAPPRTI